MEEEINDFIIGSNVMKNCSEYLKSSEIGCYNCTRWKTGSERCNNFCVKFSEFKNIDTLNSELKEKGLDYLCVSTIEELRKRR